MPVSLTSTKPPEATRKSPGLRYRGPGRGLPGPGRIPGPKAGRRQSRDPGRNQDRIPGRGQDRGQDQGQNQGQGRDPQTLTPNQISPATASAAATKPTKEDAASTASPAILTTLAQKTTGPKPTATTSQIPSAQKGTLQTLMATRLFAETLKGPLERLGRNTTTKITI